MSWMSNYQNEDGEWLMDGAAIRTEWAADEAAAYERDLDAYDDFYDNEGDCTPETHGEDCNHQKDGSWVCALCDEPCDAPDLSDFYGGEDAHLDGMWEE